jgi:hypothetical protein
MSLLNFIFGQNSGKTDLNLWVSDWLKLRSPEYQIGRSLSNLFNGTSNSSKRLAICEIRQSETRSVAESKVLGRFDLPV